MRLTWLGCALVLAGCDGTIDVPLVKAHQGVQPDVVIPSQQERQPEPMAIGPDHTSLGLRRLTKSEYGNTVLDLLGVRNAEAGLPDDLPVSLFSNNAHGLKMTLPGVQALDQAAELASAAFIAGLKAPPGCSLETLSSPCLQTLLEGWLSRAFRRPVTAAELGRSTALFTALKQSASTREALRGVVEAMLMSPSFLYRGEAGEALTQWEAASRLSYLVWGSMPDAALLAAASRGSLVDADERTAQLKRLWADPRTAKAQLVFARQWLGLTDASVSRKEASVLAGAPATLQADLDREFQLLFENQLLADTGSLETFLAGKTTWVNPGLAQFYGLQPGTRPEFQAVSLEGTPRRGVLTSGLLFAAHAKESGFSVPQLGKFFRKHILCQDIPPPPASIETSLPKTFPAGWTYRQRFEAYTRSGAACVGCHNFVNPPGFAYLPFDAIGRHTERDADGLPWVSSGTFPFLDGKTVVIRDAAQMAEKVAHSDRARDCFSRVAIENAMGRTLATEDLPLYDAVRARPKGEATRMFAVINAIVRSDAFMKRGPAL